MTAGAGAVPDEAPAAHAVTDSADTGAGPADPTVLLTEAVHRAQGGDEAAFAQVYRLVQPALVRYLRVLVGTEADDIASETWANVCRDLHRFRGDGDGFRGWVATIGRHRAVDHLRARGRRPADPVPVERLADIPAASQTDTAALDAVSTARAVALIASLPPDQAEAVMLRAVMGLDAAAAGNVLGKRPGAVRVAAHRGLRTLAHRLEAAAE